VCTCLCVCMCVCLLHVVQPILHRIRFARVCVCMCEREGEREIECVLVCWGRCMCLSVCSRAFVCVYMTATRRTADIASNAPRLSVRARIGMCVYL